MLVLVDWGQAPNGMDGHSSYCNPHGNPLPTHYLNLVVCAPTTNLPLLLCLLPPPPHPYRHPQKQQQQRQKPAKTKKGGSSGGRRDNLDKAAKQEQRMMKNRESAARSRQRRQQHTTDLEQANAKLRKEVAGLRQQVRLGVLVVCMEWRDGNVGAGGLLYCWVRVYERW